MEIFAVEKQNIHGGTLRYYVGHIKNHKIEKSVGVFIKKEKDFQLYDKKRMMKFRKDVHTQKIKLMSMLLKLKNQGKKIVCISTPAKGNTLLNYCHVDNFLIDYATEANKLKIGKYTPITHIPIYSDDKILKDKPDYALILAWNFAPQIMKKMEAYKKAGGKFIIPVPTPKII